MPRQSTSATKVVFVVGPPGSVKSTILRRVLFSSTADGMETPSEDLSMVISDTTRIVGDEEIGFCRISDDKMREKQRNRKYLKLFSVDGGWDAVPRIGGTRQIQFLCVQSSSAILPLIEIFPSAYVIGFVPPRTDDLHQRIRAPSGGDLLPDDSSDRVVAMRNEITEIYRLKNSSVVNLIIVTYGDVILSELRYPEVIIESVREHFG